MPVLILLYNIDHMEKYIPRLIDSKLDQWLRTFGAVSLVGPKGVGKTMTCEQRARSSFYFSRRPWGT